MGGSERGGAADAETSRVGATAAPVRERRMTAGREREAFRCGYGQGFIVTRGGANADRIPPGHLPPPGERRR